ncbi:MAG: phosphonate C-P lyase system protein PhnH [Candidatus Thiodiazotropha sp.]
MLEVAAIWTPNTQQQNYRALLEAMSRPGKVNVIMQETRDQTYTAILATLLDAEVSLADPDGLLDETTWPMLQANSAKPQEADYVLCSGDRPPSFQPKLGSLPSPEQSATLIIKVDSLSQGEMNLLLSGPGVDGTTRCAITGLDPDWFIKRVSWVSAFPLGVDLLLVDDTSVLALPRTTKVEVR